ncbi:PH domain-containing protein [Actinomyces faecalis]|uniref:PH domain-containing protein n=1 Tax=Actinomyces faecalis TaxID=2722820 RepID=UPI001555A3F6|nr:PH domain-containing protein [Actinomyces faecalis]
MALPRKLLSHDEVVVRHMHTHPKVLLWRIVLELVLLAAAIVGTVLAPDSWNPWGLTTIWLLFLAISLPLLLLPWLRWACTTYTVTTRRVITRSGIINKTGHDLPLTRISDIQQERTVTDRIFRAGTLSLQTSADDPLLLVDVPQVQAVQVEIANLIFRDGPQGGTD